MFSKNLKIVVGIYVLCLSLFVFSESKIGNSAVCVFTSEEIVPTGTDLEACIVIENEHPDFYADPDDAAETFKESAVGKYDDTDKGEIGTDVAFIYDGDMPDEPDDTDDAYIDTGVVFKIELITPAGNPVSAPDNSGDGRNEFTYDSASPGVLTINLKAKVTPSGVATDIADDCIFSVGSISGSTLAWDSAYPSGKPTASGDNLIATVKFTTLPTSNSAFGTKEAKITHNGTDTTECDKKDYEVFFKKTETNHPGTGAGTTPNWFYYWNSLCGDVNAEYDVALTCYGEFRPSTTTKVYIGAPAGNKNGTTGHQGIDCFAETILHETSHRTHYNETHSGGFPDQDGDWLKDGDEVKGDLNLNGVLDTEDVNSNGTIDAGEDVGLTRKEMTLSEFNSGTPVRNITYGASNGIIDAETGSVGGTSKYHANSGGGPYDDEDDACYAAENGWSAGAANSGDWANPGKQSKTGY